MEFPYNALGLSHKYIKEHVAEGDVCIDATAGRGRDTLFLSKAVGKSGKVYAFDVQKEAVESTRRLLLENEAENAHIHLLCHSRMDEVVKEEVSAVMFNFGWLPGGDHEKFSTKDTSLLAIKKALDLLKVGGIITLCLYCGKETGFEEKDAVLAFTRGLDQKKYSVLLNEFINRKNNPPVLVVITKDS